MTDKFYTFNEYNHRLNVSPSMEDYVEMIYRHIVSDKDVGVNSLAKSLHVKPSSSSKMMYRLKDRGLVNFEPYGVIELTTDGHELGKYLLDRHNILNTFFCLVNNTTSELELVEKIEHYFDKRTIENIQNIIKHKTL